MTLLKHSAVTILCSLAVIACSYKNPITQVSSAAPTTSEAKLLLSEWQQANSELRVTSSANRVIHSNLLASMNRINHK